MFQVASHRTRTSFITGEEPEESEKRLLSQTSDVFPPLKSAVGGVLALWDLVEVNVMYV
jgi:hypothetical protein